MKNIFRVAARETTDSALMQSAATVILAAFGAMFGSNAALALGFLSHRTIVRCWAN